MTAEQIIGLALALVLMLVGLAGSILPGIPSTPLVLLADRMELARAEVGDLVAVLQSGAYGLSASPTQFLSHPPPAEILI